MPTHFPHVFTVKCNLFSILCRISFSAIWRQSRRGQLWSCTVKVGVLIFLGYCRDGSEDVIIFNGSGIEVALVTDIFYPELKGTVSRDFLFYFYLWTLNQYFLFRRWQFLNFLVDHKCVKTNVNVFGYFYQIGLEFSKPSTLLFKCLAGFLKLVGSCKQVF